MTAAPQTVPAGVDSPRIPPGPGGHSSVESGNGQTDPTVPAAAAFLGGGGGHTSGTAAAS